MGRGPWSPDADANRARNRRRPGGGEASNEEVRRAEVERNLRRTVGRPDRVDGRRDRPRVIGQSVGQTDADRVGPPLRGPDAGLRPRGGGTTGAAFAGKPRALEIDHRQGELDRPAHSDDFRRDGEAAGECGTDSQHPQPAEGREVQHARGGLSAPFVPQADAPPDANNVPINATRATKGDEKWCRGKFIWPRVIQGRSMSSSLAFYSNL